MVCPSCGVQLVSDKTPFCAHCGSPIKAFGEARSRAGGVAPAPVPATASGTPTADTFRRRRLGCLVVLGLGALTIWYYARTDSSQDQTRANQPQDASHSSPQVGQAPVAPPPTNPPVPAGIQVGDRVSVNSGGGPVFVFRQLDAAKKFWFNAKASGSDDDVWAQMLQTMHEMFLFEPSTSAVVIEIDSAAPEFPSVHFAKVRLDAPKKPGYEEGWIPITMLKRLDGGGQHGSTDKFDAFDAFAEENRQLQTSFMSCLQSGKDMSDLMAVVLQNPELVPDLLTKIDLAITVCSDSMSKSRKVREDMASAPPLPQSLLDAYGQMLVDWENLNQVSLDVAQDLRLSFATQDSSLRTGYIERAARKASQLTPLRQSFDDSLAKASAELSRYRAQ